jgi:hypothetical protein
MSLLRLVLLVLVACVLLWATWALTAAFGITDPLRTVIHVAVVVAVVVWAARQGGVRV